MALLVNRCGNGRIACVGAVLRRHAVECPRLIVYGSGNAIQVATLKATYGGKYPYSKPFPYERKKYGLLESFYDKTIPRLNENSKVIVVEGNVGVGKTEFARKLATDFDMKFFPQSTDRDCFIRDDYGFDMRKLDEMLPPSAQSYDLAKFYADKHPEKGLVGKLQLQWYEKKYRDYMDALKHLLSTGQGVVLVRSVYSDSVFVEACRRMNWLTPNFVQYYYELRDNSICELWKPHLTIFLDAPIEVLRQRINKRNDPREVNSKVLSDEYLKTIQSFYRDKFLPSMRESGEVVEIDWAEVANEMDMDMIVEELQLLKLEKEDPDDTKYEDWSRNEEDDYMNLRRFIDSEALTTGILTKELPYVCPEVLPTQDDAAALTRVLLEHPVFRYRAGWAPDLGHRPYLKF